MKKYIILLVFLLSSCSTIITERDPASRDDLTCRGIVRFFQSNDKDEISSISKLTEIDDDTSMEIELRRSPRNKEESKALLRILDTEDGTLRPLFISDQMPSDLTLPENISSKIISLGHADSLENILDAKFSELPYSLQVNILKFQGKNKSTSFFKNRNIPGLVVKKKVKMKFDKKTKLLGKTYSPGEHEVDISSIFGKTKVEYRGPKSVNNFHGIEIHARTNKYSSGDLSSEVWKILKGMELNQNRGHIHVVTPLRMNTIRSDADLHATQMADYWRRVNLVAEMISIIDKGSSIRQVGEGSTIYFTHFKNQQVLTVFDYVKTITNFDDPREYRIGDRAKMAYVGFHGADKYDAQEPVWGMQFRTVSENKKVTFKHFLNAVQRNMKQGTYGSISDTSMKRWIGDLTTLDIRNRLNQLVYHNPKEANHFRTNLNITVQRFGKYVQKNKEINMLKHDWSQDPLLWENPAAVNRIKRAQIKYLSQLKNRMTDKKLKSLMWDFLEESDLYNIFLASIGG